MLKLRLLTGPRAGRQLRVSDTKPVSIGRRKGRLRLHDSRVSKDHAEISFEAGIWLLKDLGSANGTYVNREKVEGIVELEPGDLVQMGRVLVKVLRCDGIGMDTQPDLPDELVVDAPPGIGSAVAEPIQDEDDFDLDAIFNEPSEAEDPAEAQDAVPLAAEPAPPVLDEPAEVEVEAEAEEQDVEVPEPIEVAFDEPVDDDDSFFSDLGEATDTTDGFGLDEKAVATEEDEAGQEEDPFLSGTEEPVADSTGADAEDTSDQISLEDESGMGPRSAGTTLLTSVDHDDLVADAEAQSSDSFDAEGASTAEEPAEEDEAPAVVGLHLDYAPPQQPEPIDEIEEEAVEEFETLDEPEALDEVRAHTEFEIDEAPSSDDSENGALIDEAVAEEAEAVANLEAVDDPVIEDGIESPAADDEFIEDDALSEVEAQEPEADLAIEEEPEAPAEATLDSEQAAETEFETEPEEEPVSEVVSESEPSFEFESEIAEQEESEPEPEVVSEDVIESELEADEESESVLAFESEEVLGEDFSTEPDPVFEIEADSEILSELELEEKPDLEPEQEISSEVELEPAVETEPETNTEQEIDLAAELEPEADLASDLDPVAEENETLDASADDAELVGVGDDSDDESGHHDTVEDNMPEDAAFDIDAAFDALSEGLDDTVEAPAIDEPPSELANAFSGEIPASPPEEEAAVNEEPDPLVGSQLDIGFIKEALSEIESDEQAEAAPPSEDLAPKSSTTVDTPLGVPSEAPELHSPPPGLNPASLNPPLEPHRSGYPHGGRPKKGRWFFTLLLFLSVVGVGGFLIGQNYESILSIAGRDTGSAQPAGPGNDVSTPTGPTAGQPGPGDAGTPTLPAPPPSQPDKTSANRSGGPNPFEAGPAVLGGDVLQGITGGADSGRPLDPPQQPSTTGGPNPDPIRQPTLPEVGPGPLDPSVTPPATDPRAGQPDTPEPLAPVEETPARIVFLVDASGSLVDSLPQMVVWLNQALRTIEPDERFAVYFFKSDKPLAIKPAGMLAPSRDIFNQLVKDWLNPEAIPVFPSGRSNPDKAIAKALTHKPTDIYLLSDDAFAQSTGSTTPAQALDRVRQALGNSDVRIHGVQFFYRGDDSVLEDLANETDGTFEFVRERVVPNAEPIDLLEELGGE